MSTVVGSWTRFSSRLLDLLYPRYCPLCEDWSECIPCEVCTSEMTESPRSMRSGDKAISGYGTVFEYTGRGAQVVKLLKYSRRTSVAHWMSERLYHRYQVMNDPFDAVVPVPIHWTRRFARGFNQSDLLCGAFPPELVRYSLLRRVRATRPQVGLSHEERLENLKNAFAASEATGLRVLLVDDVLTSGQTARECAKALLAAGASEVSFLAFAGETR